MQHQLLFFDIDGTLLSNATHQIPESALSAIAAAQKNGHLVFINTGRTIRTMPSFLKTLGFDGYLCGCGTRIVGWGTHSPGEQLPVSLVLARPAGRLRQDRKHTCAYSAYSVMILL